MGRYLEIFGPLKALLWKNFLMHFNNWMVLALEILIPCIAALLLYGSYYSFPKDETPECNFKPKALPTASGMTAMQTFFCTVNNTCDEKSNASFDSFKSSLLTKVGDSIKTSFNLKSSKRRKREIDLDIASLARDLYTIDTVVEAIDNQNEKWNLLYNDLLRSKVYSETNERENSQIMKLLRIKRDMYTAAILTPVFRFVIKEVLSSSPEMNFMNSFLCGPDLPEIETQFLNALKSSSSSGFKLEYENDDDLSDSCNSVLQLLEMSEYKSVIDYLKPLMFGKLIYTPDAPILNKVMNRVSESFKKIKNILDLIKKEKKVRSVMKEWSLDEVLNEYKSEADFLMEAVQTNAWKEMAKRSPATSSGDSEADKFRKALEETRKNYRTFVKEAQSKPMSFYADLLECLDLDRVIAVSDESTASEKATHYLNKQKLWGYISFTNVGGGADELPASVSYTLRVPGSRGPNTKYKRNVNFTQVRRQPLMNLPDVTGGTVHIQNMIDGELIREYTGREAPGIYLQQFPYPCYKNVPTDLGSSFGSLIQLSWIYFFCQLVKTIVLEKQMFFKDILRIFGVQPYHHWIAFFVEAFVIALIPAFISSCIYASIFGCFGIILVFQMGFIMSLIGLAFLLSAFFSKTDFCTIVSTLVYFVLILLYMVFKDAESSAGLVFLCFISLMTVAFGAEWIANAYFSNMNLSFGNIIHNPDFGSPLNMLVLLFMFLIDTVIYILLAIYFENVFTKGATRRPWNYCFKATYWRNLCKRDRPVEVPSGAEPSQSSQSKNRKRDSKSFEADPEGLQPGIEVVNVTKEFGSGKSKITVVNNLSITFYENQITSFLGHNGAGKSTTVAMMTGVIPVTKGTIRIYGVDLQKNPKEALTNIGVCMQENVLLGDLSANDHLKLIGKLKNLSKKEIKRDLDELISIFEFKSRAKQSVKHLSGGWKRKVCVAMAFMGGSRTIFLDEPTAGIDPFARRAIWEVLGKLKNGRTIVLITHHLDEADILGDRVAIIASGELKCCGSGAFLKSQLDKGYTLTVDTSVRPDKASGKQSKGSKKVLSPQAQEINGVVKSAIGNAEFEEERGCEIIFSLPPKQSSSDLNRLFEALDRNKKRCNITTYGVTAASLEDVFLKVLTKIEAEENKDKGPSTEIPSKSQPKPEREDDEKFLESDKSVESSSKKRKSTLVEESEKNGEVLQEAQVSQTSLETYPKSPSRVSDGETKKVIAKRHRDKIKSGLKFGHQFYAMLYKRFLRSKRNYVFLLFEIFAPAIFLALCMLSRKVVSSFPSVVVDISRYESSILFYTTEGAGSPTLSLYEDALLGPYGLGTKCVKTPGDCSMDSIPKGSLVATGPTVDSNKCSCEDGELQCSGSATEDPPNARMSSGHRLFNMTGLDVQNWLIGTEFTYSLNRIGGITFGHFSPLTGVSIADFIELFSEQQLAKALQKYLEKVEKIDPQAFTSSLMGVINRTYGEQLFKQKEPSNNIIIWFNAAAKIGAMALINGVSNLVLRASLPAGTDPSDYSIEITVHPYDVKDSEVQTESAFQRGLMFIMLFLQVFALLFSLFIIELVEEKSCGMKHLQLICGINRIIYWFVYFLWHMILFSIFVVFLICFIFIFDLTTYTRSTSLPVFIAVVYSYGVTTIFFIYLWSLVFRLPSNAFILIMVYISFIAAIPAIFLITIAESMSESSQEVLMKIGMILPEYCLAKCILNLALSVGVLNQSLFIWDLTTKFIVRILCNGGVYVALLLLIEMRNSPPFGLFVRALACTKVFCRVSKKYNDDEDVAAEKDRVRSGRAKREGDMLIVKNLTKIYCRQMEPAVNHIHVGVKHGECLGLLGMNGAGKTTFFNMLSGNVTPSMGDATIGGYSITFSPMQARLLIGYCPQLNSLDPYMTTKEHLVFFCVIRGLSGPKRQKEVISMLELMNLTKHKDKLSRNLSGGNQRKLNAAIALLCEPELVLLDEPTAGMDVLARRFLWSRMQDLMEDGRCLVLTTHSMEECQALATQVSIMYMGRFACYGSSQHLKSKFNEGYIILLRLVTPEKSKDMTQFLQDNLSGTTIVLVQNVLMKVKLHPDTQLGKAVSALGEAKRKQLIEDYSINQTSLESVFLKLIGEADREQAYKRTCCGC